MIINAESAVVFNEMCIKVNLLQSFSDSHKHVYYSLVIVIHVWNEVESSSSLFYIIPFSNYRFGICPLTKSDLVNHKIDKDQKDLNGKIWLQDIWRHLLRVIVSSKDGVAIMLL